jgi:hypothetical protein
MPALSLDEYGQMLKKLATMKEARAESEKAKPPLTGQWGDPTVPPGFRYDPMMDCVVPIGLTRFDPSTKTRVPVTQEWVDEAVAEIVRLNIELGAKAEPMPGTDMLKVDRIWDAVVAASSR